MVERQIGFIFPPEQPPEVEEACRWCDQEIAAGRYDENLYTPAEARAARKAGTYNDVLTRIREGRFIQCAACRCWHAPGEHRP